METTEKREVYEETMYALYNHARLLFTEEMEQQALNVESGQLFTSAMMEAATEATRMRLVAGMSIPDLFIRASVEALAASVAEAVSVEFTDTLFARFEAIEQNRPMVTVRPTGLLN